MKYSNFKMSALGQLFLAELVGNNLRETLNHFRRMRRIPDTALAVISRDLIASISSTGNSAGSIELGRGILAGSCCLFCP